MTATARTNVSTDAESLKQAREFDGGQQKWLAENRGPLADANDFLRRHGLWSDGRRQF